MSKAVSKKAIDETQSDNYRAGFNYGRLARAGINAFRDLVIAYRTGNLEASNLLCRTKRNSSVISGDVLNVPAFLRKSNLSAVEYEKKYLGGFPKNFKHFRYYDMNKTLEILGEDGAFDSFQKNRINEELIYKGETHGICH